MAQIVSIRHIEELSYSERKEFISVISNETETFIGFSNEGNMYSSLEEDYERAAMDLFTQAGSLDQLRMAIEPYRNQNNNIQATMEVPWAGVTRYETRPM